MILVWIVLIKQKKYIQKNNGSKTTITQTQPHTPNEKTKEKENNKNM